MPRMLTNTNVQRKKSEMVSRTFPLLRALATPLQSSATATSRRKGTTTYETAPMTIESPNHCEKLAANPR